MVGAGFLLHNTKHRWKSNHRIRGLIASSLSIDNPTKKRKWNWIGHTLRKETGAIEETA